MKLTERQKELMECIDKYSYNGYFYAECGGWKPFNVKTIKSLVDKGLIDLHTCGTLFPRNNFTCHIWLRYLKLSEIGVFCKKRFSIILCADH